jgi:hypothetical protein
MIQQECLRKSYQADSREFKARATFTINNTVLGLVNILLVQGQAEVSAIRFSPASPLDIGKFPREIEALHEPY